MRSRLLLAVCLFTSLQAALGGCAGSSPDSLDGTNGAGAGGSSAGTSSAGGGATVGLCENVDHWACNAVSPTGQCNGPGSACDIGSGGELQCFPAPNTAAVGEACDPVHGPYCAQGGGCIGGTCARYCCGDVDCGGAGVCELLTASSVQVVVGVCRPGAGMGAGGMGAGGTGAAGSAAGPGAGGSGAGPGGGGSGTGAGGGGAGPGAGGTAAAGTGGTSAGAGGTVAACTDDTWANFAQAVFQNSCTIGCHSHSFGNKSPNLGTIQGEISAISSRVKSGNMPQSPGKISASDKTRLLKWLSCGAPMLPRSARAPRSIPPWRAWQRRGRR